MIIWMIPAVLILLLLLSMYYLYCQIFCYPLKKRPELHQIPESNLYKAYKDRMTESIQEMEKTPCENVSIVSVDGCRLCGKLYRAGEKSPLMLFFHGYHGMAAWDGYGIFKICRENGFSVLMVDERAHGNSEGSAITFGIKERYDCKLWTEYAVKLLGEETDISLAGVSMGAASVMMASELELPGNVKGIVADCGYSSPAAIIKETIRIMKFPVEPVYWFVRLSARLFGRFDLEEASPLKAMKKLEIPILFIHGTKDSVVPLSMAEELYENCVAKKERVWIEGADHANSALTDYETYKEAVLEFLKQNLSRVSR